MKIAIISDIHANYTALQAVYDDARSQGVSQIYCLGDLVGYHPQIDEVMEFVIDRNIICILGNYDKACLAQSEKEGLLYLKQGISDEKRKIFLWSRKRISSQAKDFLSGLPIKLELMFEKNKMLLVHGSPSGITNYVYPNTSRMYLESMLKENLVDMLVCGHTHIPMHIETREGHILNPGSVGVPKDGNPEASYLIMEPGVKPSFMNRRVPFDGEYVAAITRERVYAELDSL